MISCVLLAAGSSVRFGSAKALATINQQTIIERLQEVLTQSAAEEIIVVLGDYADAIKPRLRKHKKIKVAFNENFNLGQTSSFQTGLKSVSAKASGIMLLPVDVPAIQVETINLLVKRFKALKSKILIPVFNGKRGHPPIFNATLKNDILHMGSAIGLNQFIHQHESEIELFPVDDPGVAWSFNTLEEFEQLKAYFKFSP